MTLVVNEEFIGVINVVLRHRRACFATFVFLSPPPFVAAIVLELHTHISVLFGGVLNRVLSLRSSFIVSSRGEPVSEQTQESQSSFRGDEARTFGEGVCGGEVHQGGGQRGV